MKEGSLLSNTIVAISFPVQQYNSYTSSIKRKRQPGGTFARDRWSTIQTYAKTNPLQIFHETLPGGWRSPASRKGTHYRTTWPLSRNISASTVTAGISTNPNATATSVTKALRNKKRSTTVGEGVGTQALDAPHSKRASSSYETPPWCIEALP